MPNSEDMIERLDFEKQIVEKTLNYNILKNRRKDENHWKFCKFFCTQTDLVDQLYRMSTTRALKNVSLKRYLRSKSG